MHSVNGTFPDSTAVVLPFGSKIALRARLFGGQMYRGILRPNELGSLGCCKEAKGGGLAHCPVVSWWADDGDRSCWETTRHPSDSDGECSE